MVDPLAQLRDRLADRYSIEQPIGEGGMATVYLAHDVKHERRVAVKVLRPELAAVLGHERFLREITTTANLRHPHILPLYDSGEMDGTLFYVMPLVEGESLRDRLDREKQLPLDDALAIAHDVGDALSYAHARGVVHRDIKPENILLESGHAVVADFGIALGVSAAGGEKLTMTGMAVGTPAYMSPEQAGGSGEVDGRSDLYALACVLYEMLGGQPPFTGPTVESLVHQHLRVVPPPITNLRPAVPAEVTGALDRALAKTPADRFDPVSQFIDALRAPAGSTLSASAETVAQRPFAWRPLVGIVGAVALVGALVLWLGGNALSPFAGGGRSLSSLAVLPFEDRAAEMGQEYFVDGMTDALITELSKIEALRVIARTSVMQYRGTDKTTRDIARELNVDGIVAGSVLRADGRVRVSVQLVDAADDRTLWAESYDGGLGDVLALHSEVARAIAGEVRVVLTDADEIRLTAARAVDQAAHDLLLRGRYFWERGSLPQALAMFEAAVVEDSLYPEAWAWISRVHAAAGGSDPTRIPRARRALQRALEIKTELPEVQTAVGHLAFYQDWDWETARRALERAIDLNPGFEDAHQIYGDYFEVLGDWDRAIAEGVWSKDVNPVSADMRMNLGLTYVYAGRPDDAIEECRGALELDSLSAWPYFCLADAHRMMGAWTEAVQSAEAAVQLNPTPMNRVMLARVFASSGNRARADSILTALAVESKDRYVSPWVLAWGYATMQNWERAYAYLERAVAERARFTPWANVVSDFDPVRSEPRFLALLARMGLGAEAR